MIKGIAAGALTLALAGLLFASVQRGRRTEAKAAETAEIEQEAEQTAAGQTETAADRRELKVDQISISGLSEEEARKKLLEAYAWDLKLSYQDSEVSLENPLPEEFDRLLQEIYEGESKAQEVYELDTAALEEGIRVQVAAAAAKWDRSPSVSQLTGRDKEKGSWIYTGGESGLQVDQEAAVREIMGLLAERTFVGVVTVQTKELPAERTAAEVKKKYQVIGTFSTTATNNSNRNNNIRLAINAIDGLVIFPGEEFSFNQATGNRTTERGYLPAGAYRDGKFVEEPGGGVCQVSSTLYNAIIFSGIKTTERHAHSFEPSYVIPGEDAMVSYDGYSGPDLRFINQQSTSVAIRAVFEGTKLTISIVGIPILEDGVTIAMRSQKTKEYDPPTPSYQEDQTLQPGAEQVVQEGVKGSEWKTWLVTTRDGAVEQEVYFHTSTYKGKPGVTKRNTTGVVIPLPSETGAAGAESIEMPPSAAVEQPQETLPPAENAPQGSSPAGENSAEAGAAAADSAANPRSGPGSE